MRTGWDGTCKHRRPCCITGCGACYLHRCGRGPITFSTSSCTSLSPWLLRLLTKPLSMIRHRLFRVSMSLVKWNCTRREFRNSGTRVVCGKAKGHFMES